MSTTLMMSMVYGVFPCYQRRNVGTMIFYKKHKNKRFVEIFLGCLLAVVAICLSCIDRSEINPNLKLLVGDTTTKYENIHCSNPVISPKEEKVYYLRKVNEDCSIYCVNIDGSNNSKIFEGTFDALSISHDGKKLAVHANRNNHPYFTPESLILVVKLDSLAITNVDSFWITPRWISKIEWNHSDEFLGYMSSEKVYRLDLLTGNEEIFATISDIAGFDLYSNDSIHLDPFMEYFQINEVHETYAIGIEHYDEDFNFLLRNIVINKLDTLPDSLMPYTWGTVGYPYWFPNGMDIVFMAKPYTEPAGEGSGEIWILENLFEQIEE